MCKTLSKKILIGFNILVMGITNVSLFATDQSNNIDSSMNVGTNCNKKDDHSSLIEYLQNDSNKNNCFSALTCDDKIILSQLQYELRSKFNKGDYIDSFLSKLKGAQKHRIKKLLLPEHLLFLL